MTRPHRRLKSEEQLREIRERMLAALRLRGRCTRSDLELDCAGFTTEHYVKISLNVLLESGQVEMELTRSPMSGQLTTLYSCRSPRAQRPPQRTLVLPSEGGVRSTRFVHLDRRSWQGLPPRTPLTLDSERKSPMPRNHVHGDSPSSVRLPRRARLTNLSRTTPPVVEPDVSLWPSWTMISVECDLNLDLFDDAGFPIQGHSSGR